MTPFLTKQVPYRCLNFIIAGLIFLFFWLEIVSQGMFVQVIQWTSVDAIPVYTFNYLLFCLSTFHAK